MARRRRRAQLEFSGQPYGSRQSRAAQNSAVSQVAGAGGGGGPADPAAMIAALEAEDPTPIQRRSARPGEPITSGLPVGAGPGPEVLPARAQAPPQPRQRVDVETFAAQMPMLELLANQPGASRESQIFYRNLRSQMPFDVQTFPAGSRTGNASGAG